MIPMKVRWPKLGSSSLKSILLWTLIPALLIVMSTALWLSSSFLRQQVNAAYDRSLSGALRAIDHNISTESGGLSVELPYLMLEFFELAADDNVYYRIFTEDGLADIGNQQLPLPDAPLKSNTPVFYTKTYLGEPIRIAAFARAMEPPLYNNVGGRVIVLVGENLNSREQFIQAMMIRTLLGDLIVLFIIILVVTCGVLFAIRPLTRLNRELRARRSEDLRPIVAPDLPNEVQPLLAAINQHVERHARQARVQRQFLDDASHQLRTPLAILRMQLGYAMRETDPSEARGALLAMREGLDRAERTAAQLLALARAKEQDPLHDRQEIGAVDLLALAQGVIKDTYPLARSKRQTISLDAPDHPVQIQGMEWLLREAMLNLADNAIRYTPSHGSITVSIEQSTQAVSLIVEDSGPGMSEADIQKAATRFRRGKAGKNSTGAGLGLSIVRTIMTRHQGHLQIESTGHGCRMALVFTLKNQ